MSTSMHFLQPAVWLMPALLQKMETGSGKGLYIYLLIFKRITSKNSLVYNLAL